MRILFFFHLLISSPPSHCRRLSKEQGMLTLILAFCFLTRTTASRRQANDRRKLSKVLFIPPSPPSPPSPLPPSPPPPSPYSGVLLSADTTSSFLGPLSNKIWHSSVFSFSVFQEVFAVYRSALSQPCCHYCFLTIIIIKPLFIFSAFLPSFPVGPAPRPSGRQGGYPGSIWLAGWVAELTHLFLFWFFFSDWLAPSTIFFSNKPFLSLFLAAGWSFLSSLSIRRFLSLLFLYFCMYISICNF